MARHVFRPHQQRAYRYAKTRNRIALFMEQRLGKSSVAIRWAKTRQAKRVLLVAPLNTLLGSLNWQGELLREGIHATMLPTIPKARRLTAVRAFRREHGRLKALWGRGWYAVNFEALRTQPELLAEKWDTIIVDESTRIRSPKAQVTRALVKHAQSIPNRAILSGLPNPEDATDYFSQFQFLNGHFMKYDNFWKFRHALFRTYGTQWNWQPRPGTRDRIKQYVNAQAFVLTRKQAGVGSSKVRSMRTCELNATQKKLMKEIKTTFAVGDRETKWITVRETWLQRIAGGFHPITHDMISDSKIRMAEELLVEDFRREPIVMWFKFTREIEALYAWMRRRHTRVKIAYVHGGIHKRERPRIQERFQDGSIDVILMQVKLGRFGWNLSRSSTSIYYSNTYEYEDRAQSEDRIIHLTKTDPCLFMDLVTLGTPDEDVVDAIVNKRVNAQSFSRAMHQSVLRYAA